MKLGKHRFERDGRTRFRCKLCGRSKFIKSQVSRIIFGRRRWYELCDTCIKPKSYYYGPNHSWRDVCKK